MKTSPMHGLRTVINLVPDLDKAKAWDAKAFGTKPYFDEPFYVGFNIGGYELGLLPEEGPKKPRGENVMTYWGVDDVQKAFDRLISLGASTCEEQHRLLRLDPVVHCVHVFQSAEA